MFAVEPTLAVATEKMPVPVAPGTSTVPLFPIVAATAITSGTGIADDDRRSVVRPGVSIAGPAFEQANRRSTSVGANAASGVTANTKLWLPNEAMSTGVL